MPSTWLIALALTVPGQFVPPPDAPARAAAGLRGDHASILADEADRLEALADRLEADAAARVRGLIERPEAGDGASSFAPLAEIVPAGLEEGRPPEVEAVRGETADALFALAARAAGSEPPSMALADACLRGVVARRPDHAEARRLLGFVPHRGGWATPFAARQLDLGRIPHPVYGWVDADWVPRLARGELPAPRDGGAERWLPAAEADALRRAWEDGWQIETEHFQIQANVPLDEAIAFVRQLETLHEVFFARMADVVGPELPLARRLRNPRLEPQLPSRKHRVNYFASRADYLAQLVPRHGEGLKGSIGFYLPPRDARRLRQVPTSSFFRDPEGQIEATATLFHEVSHQLLFESAGPDAHERNEGQFWVFEGLGTYFETMQIRPDGTVSIGGPIGPRLAEARARLVDRGELIPTRRFVAMSKDQFNRETAIHLHYQEAMALATHLMQRDGGAFRDAFLDYVRDAYRGRVGPRRGRSLDDRLGISYERLDADLLGYLASEVPAAAAGP